MKYKIPAVIALAAIISLTTIQPAEASHRTSQRTSEQRNESWSSRRLPSKAQAEANKLSRQDKLDVIPVPILFGVDVTDIHDSWGDARSSGRTHEGTDIMAPRGAYVIAPSNSVVSDIGFGANGGNYVYTINPGGERFYFAHLDENADGLKVGDILEKGDLIGYVGNTGNASGGAPHLHFGVYSGGAQNPFPRLTAVLTTKERLDAVESIIEDADDGDVEAAKMVAAYPTFFRSMAAAKESLPEDIEEALAKLVVAPIASGGGVVGFRDLTLGSQGADVVTLQKTLIAQEKGQAATALAGAGATGYFGPMTQRALAEWQAAVGISPAVGYYGAITRGKVAAL